MGGVGVSGRGRDGIGYVEVESVDGLKFHFGYVGQLG